MHLVSLASMWEAAPSMCLSREPVPPGRGALLLWTGLRSVTLHRSTKGRSFSSRLHSIIPCHQGAVPLAARSRNCELYFRVVTRITHCRSRLLLILLSV